MAKRSLPEISELRQLLRYEAETGAIYWLPRSAEMFTDSSYKGGLRTKSWAANGWNTRFSGKQAFTSYKDGYRTGAIWGVNVRAHRAAWALYYGQWPSDHVDHINGDRSDNRISNLTLVTNFENHRNTGKSKNNTTGANGVYWCKQTKKFRALIKVRYKSKCLGRYDTLIEAIAARDEGNRLYGFSPRHGRHLSCEPSHKRMGKQLRFMILARDNFRCRYCGATPKAKQLHVDHIVPISSGGSFDMSNLVTACNDCNTGKLNMPINPLQIPT